MITSLSSISLLDEIDKSISRVFVMSRRVGESARGQENCGGGAVGMGKDCAADRVGGDCRLVRIGGGGGAVEVGGAGLAGDPMQRTKSADFFGLF